MALTKISGNVIKDSVSLAGNVSIGGTLTYQDVTNIDAVGLITARTGIKVLAGGINAVGVVTATSFSGNGANLTGITQTTINNNSANRIITGSSTGNTLEANSNFTYTGSVVTHNNPSGLAKLDVKGSVGGGALGASISVRNANSANNGSGEFQFQDPGSNIFAKIAGVNLTDGSNNGYMSFHTSSATSGLVERARIDDSGRVLIGTTSQNNNAKLQVTTNQQVVATFEGTGVSDPQIYVGDNMASPTDNCIILGYDKADNRGYLTVGGDGDNVFTITNGGNIGINQSSPQANAKLHVEGNVGSSGYFYTTTTSSPQTDFTSSIASNKAGLLLHRTSETNGDYGGLEFHNHPSSITTYRKGGIYFQSDGSGFGRGDIVICNDGAGDSNNLTISDEKMRIHKEGHVTKQHSCAFNVTHNGHQNYNSAGTHTISSWKTTDSFRGFEHTSGGGYFSNGIFTAPVTGAYFFTSTLLLRNMSGTNDVHVFWARNGNHFTYWETRFNGNPTGYGNYEPVSGQCVMKMDAGDVAAIRISFSGSGCGIHGVDQNWGNWGGYLIG